jgi:hypothetical protein
MQAEEGLVKGASPDENSLQESEETRKKQSKILLYGESGQKY